MKDVNNELMNKKIDEEEQIENERSNKFNLIIGVSTLLIAILGATFAYFSATARSEEGDVNVKSAYVSISYDGGTEIKASNLIPSTEKVAISKFKKQGTRYTTIKNPDNLPLISEEDQDKPKLGDEYSDRKCIDANGRQVCYVYQFTINSDGEAGRSTALTGYITVDSNEFDNLSYTVYEVTVERDENAPASGANPEENIYIDKYGHKIVSGHSPISGDRYHPEYFLSKIEKETTLNGVTTYNTLNINEIETNELNTIVDNDIPTFSTFTKPFDLKGDNGELIRTVYPVECLFGYSENYASLDADNPERCRSYSITNGEPHTYQVMIWLNETGDVQPEQGLSFSGTVSLEVPGGQDTAEDERITGKE